MCRQIKCSRCGRPTWSGCGAQVEQVLAAVPPADRCTCREAPVGHRSGRAMAALRTATLVAAVGGAVYLAFPAGGDITCADAHALVEKGARLIDVRTPAEFAAGHVPGAINIPLDEVPDRLDEFGPADEPIVLYCRTGNRSGNATRILEVAGHTQVHDLGAMSNW